jgi:hypothetical protein
MRSVMQPATGHSRRAMLPLLLAYPVLALAGAWTHRQIFPLAALLLLITLWMLPRLSSGRAWPWLLWAAAAAAMVGMSLLGLADLLLLCLPLLIDLLLACWFGRTLRAGCEPLVARFVRIIEGPQRLTLPGVARYVRGVTVFWTVLLSLQAAMLALWLVFQPHDGVLARLGFATSLPWSGRWLGAYMHVGGLLVIPLAFVLEYAYRRWHLRHLAHAGWRQLIVHVMQRWPQLMREEKATP